MYNDEIYKTYEGMVDTVNRITDDIIKETTENLKIKYECDFKALKVGNRIDTGSTTIYFCPEDNEKIVFIATVDAETNKVKDDYITKLVSEKIKDKCENKFDSHKLSATCNVYIYGETPDDETNTEITVDDYLAMYPVSSIFIYMAVDNACVDEIAHSLIQSVKELSSEYDVPVVVSGFVVGKDYNECRKQLDIEPDVSDTWFYDFDVLSSFKFAVTDSVCNVSEQDIFSEIKR